MKIFSAKVLIRTFNFICLAVAGSLIVYWMYEFSLDKDISTIDYKRFHESDQDKFPLLSICFKNFLSETKLWEQNNRTNVLEYLSFLRGNHFNPELLKIDYDKVSMNISKYLVKYLLLKRDGSGIEKYH